jgi:hypothetical protein
MINCRILKTMSMKEGIMSIKINRRLHEALGWCWHEYDHWKGRRQVCRCGQWLWYFDAPVEWGNPNYCADPRLVIEVMREKEDFVRFIRFLSKGMIEPAQSSFICIDLMMDKTGKLAELAIEWLAQKEGV